MGWWTDMDGVDGVDEVQRTSEGASHREVEGLRRRVAELEECMARMAEALVVLEATEGVHFRGASMEKGNPVGAFGASLTLEWAEVGPGPVPTRKRQLMVIMRDLQPGESQEIRLVKPRDVVMGDDDIDWGLTPFLSFMWLEEEVDSIQ